MPRPAPVHKSFTDRNSLYQEITDKIIAELERGRVPWVQPWGNTGAPLGTPRNAATQRPYSGINILILWMACTERGFTGQNWPTFRQALKIGAHVRKGEKGTTVVYTDRFVPYRERTRAADTGDEPEAIPFLKRFTVFNADQCEDLPADIAPPPSSYFEPINWHRTVCHELGHYAVSRIMPHGRALRRANLFRAMRRFGIIEPSGNDEVWREADWRLQEFVFDCRHRRALASLRATSQRTRQRKPPAPRTRRVWAEKT
jgi:antirestriction protein ArdC